MRKLYHNLEYINISQGKMRLYGWAAGAEPDQKVDFAVMDSDDHNIPYKMKTVNRPDVTRKVYHIKSTIRFGFVIEFEAQNDQVYRLKISSGEDTKIYTLTAQLIAYLSVRNNVQSTWSRIRNIHLLLEKRSTTNYSTFRQILQMQEKKVKREKLELHPDSPLFSIVIPLYATPERYLRELIESIEKQTYQKYEVCFADGSPEDQKLEELIGKYQKDNYRIRYQYLNGNFGISGNTNEAVKMASGDFIVLCDHDDLLSENALYELAKAVIENPECDCIYSDEDKIDETSKKYFDPHFKPDYNIDLLTSCNYICHIYAVRKSLVDKTGAFRSEYDGAQDHDFILRTTEQARQIVHIPKVLYHWRTHMASTAANPESKLYAFEAGKKAVRAHFERVWPQYKVEKVTDGASLGIYHTYFDVKEELISVIIPNKDHTEDLDKAIRSMIEKGSWKQLEFIIVENNSEKEETFAYYEKIQKEYSQVRVVYYEGGFNYSRINNFGAKYAKGRYLLLMNNDVELIEKDSMKEMMGYCQRDDVGIVGCRLLYEDDTIQHAGVIVGVSGIAGHAFKDHYSDEFNYFNRAVTVQDLSAVTAAVMLVKKEVYDEVGGLDESFEVAFNDIDFCLRVRDSGRLVVYNPYACFHHYESKSRGMEDTPEKQQRFRGEIVRFLKRHKDFLAKGDPMYNPNLTIADTDYNLRNLCFDKVGDPFYRNRQLHELLSLDSD